MNNLHERLILTSPELFDRVFLFDPETLRYEVSPKNVSCTDKKTANGMASLKEGGFCALYNHQNRLWAAFDARVYAVTDALTSNWSMEDWKPAADREKKFLSILKSGAPVSSARKFRLIQNNTVLEERSYIIVENDPATRPFVIWDSEDEDFLLWMHNVLHSDERKHLVLENWKY